MLFFRLSILFQCILLCTNAEWPVLRVEKLIPVEGDRVGCEYAFTPEEMPAYSDFSAHGSIDHTLGHPLSPGYHFIYHMRKTPARTSVTGAFSIEVESNCVPEIHLMDRSKAVKRIGNVDEDYDALLLQVYRGTWSIPLEDIKRHIAVLLYLPHAPGCQYQLEHASITFYRSATDPEGFTSDNCPMKAPIGSMQMLQLVNQDLNQVRVIDAWYNFNHFQFQSMYDLLPSDIQDQMAPWTTAMPYISIFVQTEPRTLDEMLKPVIRMCDYFNHQLRVSPPVDFKLLRMDRLREILSQHVNYRTLPPVPTLPAAFQAYKEIEFISIRDSLPTRGESMELPHNLDQMSLIQAVYYTIRFDIESINRNPHLSKYLRVMFEDLLSIEQLVSGYATTTPISNNELLIRHIVEACELACAPLDLNYRTVSAATFLVKALE